MKRLALVAIVPFLLCGCLGKAMLDAEEGSKKFETNFETMFKEKSPEDIAKMFATGVEARSWLADTKNELLLNSSGPYPDVVKSLYDNGCPMVKIGDILDFGDGKKTATSIIVQMPTSANQRAAVWQIYQTVVTGLVTDTGQTIMLFGF
jgi:hypothetical protein